MQRSKWIVRIGHILDSISNIQSYTQGMNPEAFCSNRVVVDAVLRNFTVIGEAARNIPPEVTAAHPEVPWRLMQDMRNVLVHDYPNVNIEVIWNTIQNDLQPLAPLLKRILQQGVQ